MSPSAVDMLWVVLGAGLVFLMQAGFLALETGMTRSKNNINVAMKNLADFGLSTLFFWALGYALMFGSSKAGWFGSDNFLLDVGADSWTAVFFLFQVMFCGTAVTIISGGVAERLLFRSYLLVAVVVSAVIYPVFGHWAWNGLDTGASNGVLAASGFVDFAGSTVVHSVGGWATLALLVIIGPRKGRFPEDGPPRQISGSNMTQAGLGVLLLWVGWLGFNGGSTLAFNDQVPLILANTMIAGAAGLGMGLLLGGLLHRHMPVEWVFNGALAGLVAITANAHAVSATDAALIGAIGNIIAVAVEKLLERLRIDDVIGAVPVHLGAGAWGTLAVGLFADLDTLGTGLNRIEQIGVQALGIIACGLWTFGLCWLIFGLWHRFFHMRIDEQAEAIGLNVAEHGASSDLQSLLDAMTVHSQSHDLRMRVPVEPFTEVGQIASRYNGVIVSLERSIGLIAENAPTLISATGSLSESNSRLFAASDQTFDQADAVAGASRQINDHIHAVAASIEQMHAAAQGIAADAERAAGFAGEAVSAVQSTRETVTDLGRRSSEIDSVIRLINDVTEQTELLALNAGIEAARAGEAGKGFAVVAREVKKLARDTAEATAHITEMIETVQADIRRTVNAMQHIGAVIEQIRDYQQSIAAAVEQQSAAASEIKRNISETVQDSGEITHMIGAVVQAARETNAATEKSRTTADELAEIAAQMQSLVQQFQFGRSGRAGDAGADITIESIADPKALGRNRYH